MKGRTKTLASQADLMQQGKIGFNESSAAEEKREDTPSFIAMLPSSQDPSWKKSPLKVKVINEQER